MLHTYYSLLKPGIIYGNLITVAAGFFLGAKGEVHLPLLLFTLFGISLIIGSGCVLNNIIDRDIDGLMERTRKRALVNKLIPISHAYVYASLLGLLGTTTLGYFTNITTLLVALFGLFAYIVIYTLWAKRTTVYGTLLGSISGAIPPVVGYVAASNTLDTGAVLLFLLLTFWQMPHSYAIGIYRREDYVNANIPVLPTKIGIRATKFHMLFWVLMFSVPALLIHYYTYAGKIYFSAMLGLCTLWTVLACHGFFVQDDRRWAKQMFAFSLIVIVGFSMLIFFDNIRLW